MSESMTKSFVLADYWLIDAPLIRPQEESSSEIGKDSISEHSSEWSLFFGISITIRALVERMVSYGIGFIYTKQ